MRIVVTGAAGFIGGEVCRQMRARGIEVIGLDARAAEGCLEADIRDPAIADLIPQGADALVHLSALSRDPDCRNRGRQCFDVNVMGTFNLMEAAEARGVRQFLFASSEWVYDSFQPGMDKTEDEPIDAQRLTSEYAFSKFVSEVNLRQKAQHGFCAATILRFGIVYGSRRENWSAVEALFNTVATRDEVSVGSLATGRRFLHVSDVAGGVLAALGREGCETFNIQGPRMITLGDVISTSARLLGRSPQVVETAPASPSLRPVSSAKAERMLGWRAAVELEEGLLRLREFLGMSVP